MRLFIAVDVTKQAEEELLRLQGAIQSFGKNCGLRATYPRTFHLTLKFLGAVNEDNLQEIIANLDQVQNVKLSLTLSATGFFPDKSAPKVVWAGVKPATEIISLQSKIDTAVKKCSVIEQKFHPHLTLARIKHIQNKKNYLDYLLKLNLKEIPFDVNSFTLYESRLSSMGPVYQKVKEWKLL